MVTESMLPKFTMCPRTFDPETCNVKQLIGTKKKSSSINQKLSSTPYLGETVGPIGEVLQVTEKSSSDYQQVVTASRSHLVYEGTYENMRGAEQSHRDPPLQATASINSISVEEQTATLNGRWQQPGVSHNANSLAPSSEVLGGMGSQLKINNIGEYIYESRPYMEPYKSTFFYPLLDDYNLPGSQRFPAFSWHTEKPIHPIPTSPVNVMGPIDSRDGMILNNTHSEDASENSELLELLTPMTDEEQDWILTDRDSEYEDNESQLLRFPRNASREVVESYALVSNALKLGLQKRDEVLDASEQGAECNNARVEMQEEWERKEKWVERSRGSGGMRSKNGGAGPEYPDFLDWLRQKGREE